MLSLGDVLANVVRAVLGGLFVLAGVLKLQSGGQFAIEIANYQLFPSLAPYLAVALPPIEVLAGVALVIPGWRRAGALCITGLLVMFTVAVTTVRLRGINVDCGCFGGDSGPITWWTVARDVLLLALAALLSLRSDRPKA